MSKIYVSELSLKRTLADQQLAVTELPDFIRRHGYDGLELLDRRLAGVERSELREFARACEESRCDFVFDVSCDLTYKDDTIWRQEIEYVCRMLELALELQAQVVKIWLGGQTLSIQKILGHKRRQESSESQQPDPKSQSSFRRLASNRKISELAHALRVRLPSRAPGLGRKTTRAIDALQKIVPRAEQLDLRLAIENHWGISSRPEIILQVIEALDSSHLGACPDFGNLPRDVDLYRSLELLGPRAFLVHAKSSRFDDAGEERDIDYARCLRILRDCAYRGAFSIEYVGAGDELAGCLRTRQLIERQS